MQCRRDPITLLLTTRIVAVLVIASAAISVPPDEPVLAQSPAAQADVSDARPYDDKLMRLSEILGALHYLRELCGGNEGQAWRDRMRELIDSDKGSALRRVKLTKSFNQGYRSYKRTYSTCSPSARTALTRFISEGVELSDLLLRETQ